MRLTGSVRGTQIKANREKSMSNGEPVSGSPYIIICGSRIAVALAKDYDAKVYAASQGAAQFAAFMGVIYGDSDDWQADIQPLAKLQHQLMNHAIEVHKLSHEEIDN